MKYKETSLIVDLYTEALGLQKVIVHGVRSRSARSQASLYQVLSLIDIVLYHRDDRDLHRLKEVTPSYMYEKLPFEVTRGAVGMFIVEIARKTIRNTEQNKPLFQFLHQVLLYLDQSKVSIANVHLYFMIELSGYLGFYPDTNHTEEYHFFDLQEGWYTQEAPFHGYFLGPEQTRQFAHLQQLELSDCHQLKLSREGRHRLLEKLLLYYRLHLEHLPVIHSHQILKDIF